MRQIMNNDSTALLHSGNSIPVIGLGTWQLTRDTAETVAYALDYGYRMVDTSSDYGTQPGVGKGIKLTSVPREKIYVVTKVEETDDSYERTKSNLDELGLDYIDLMLIHRPPEKGAGEELWEGLIEAKDEGLVHDIGVSNYTSSQIKKLIDFSDEIPVINQIEWSPFGHSQEMLDFCRKNNILIQAYSPLTRAKRLNDNRLQKIAAKYDKSPTQILLRWNLERGSIPIPKANQRKHLEENLEIFEFELMPEDVEILNSFNEEFSSLGSLPYI